MAFGSQASPQSRSLPGSVEQFHVCAPGSDPPDGPYQPRLYFETKIDFADVRSGFRATTSLSNSVDVFPIETDLLWTPDMVRQEDPGHIRVGPPATGRFLPLRDRVDEECIALMQDLFLDYLMRHQEVAVLRNFSLNRYSGAAESLDDFKHRCAELLEESFKEELDGIHDVVQRKMESLRELYQRGTPIDFGAVKAKAHWKSRMHEVSERLTNLFLQTDMMEGAEIEVPDYPVGANEIVEERLLYLEIETRKEIARLRRRYHQELSNVDEYRIRPNYRDIHPVRSGVLWVPVEES